MDRLPRRGLDPLHVVLKRLEARPLVEAEPHEAAEGGRVLEMELELPETEAMDLLQQSDPENLVARQASTARVVTTIAHQVEVHELPQLRMNIQNPVDHLELSGMLMRTPSGREGQPVFSWFSRNWRIASPPGFTIHVVSSVGCCHLTYNDHQRIGSGDCANFFSKTVICELSDGKYLAAPLSGFSMRHSMAHLDSVRSPACGIDVTARPWSAPRACVACCDSVVRGATARIDPL